jgi:hypothetical protein
MGSKYKAKKNIRAGEMFDGRLEKFGIREDGQASENYRCLTDGESCGGVVIDGTGNVTGFQREWNDKWTSPEKILSAISDTFKTQIFNRREPEYSGLDSEEEKAAWRARQSEIEEWLAIREAEALKIDPDTAEVDWTYAQTLDPYGVYPELPEEFQQIGREYFARVPGSDVWVEFGDLPEGARERLWARHSRTAGLEGLPGSDPETSVSDLEFPPF